MTRTNHMLSSCVAIIIAVGFSSVARGDDGGGDVWTLWRNARKEPSAEQVMSWKQKVAASTLTSQERVLQLVEIAETGEVHPSARFHALMTASEISASQDTNVIIGTITRWAALRTTATRSDRAIAENGRVLRRFVRDRGLQQLQEAHADAESILACAYSIDASFPDDPRVRKACRELIMESPAPLASRQRIALRIFADGQGDEALYAIIDDGCIIQLVSMCGEVEESRRFNWSAAATVAHFGNQDIVPTLLAMQSRFENDTRVVGRLEAYLWMIDVQSSATGIVDCIASGEVNGVINRRWAVRRARELGIADREIRDAIFLFRSRARGYLAEVRVKGVVQLASSLGILSDADVTELGSAE